MEITSNFEDIGKRYIPFKEVARLISIMPYGSRERIIIMWLAETGARPCEIEHRRMNEIQLGGYWIWQPRKKQKKVRHEKLSKRFWDEFQYYVDNHDINNNNVFMIMPNTFRKKIVEYRKKLGGHWLEKVPVFGEHGISRYCYRYQINYLRHNFQTFKFRHYQDEYGKDQALNMVSRDMRHSSSYITGTHYIESLKGLGLDTIATKQIKDLVYGVECQSKFTNFMS